MNTAAARPASAANGWRTRLLPFLLWLPLVNRSTLRADLLAGLSGGIVLVPQGVAFATIAGLPPQYGLYAAMLPAIVAALWGSSWHLVSGPTTAISIVVFATISPLAPAGSPEYVGLVLTLTLMVGIFQLALGLLGMGAVVNFVSHTVVLGFTAGAAVLIAASQVQHFFGITLPRGASLLQVLLGLLRQLGDINAFATAVALATVAASVLVRRWWPAMPHMIAGMLTGGALAAVLDAVFSPAATRLQYIGALPLGLPPLSLPDVSPATLERLVPIAVAVALLALTEAVSIARAIGSRTGQRIDGNQEFIGQGLSNIAGAFSSGYASSGSFNRSALNLAAGARTPLASVFASLSLLVIVLFLAPLARHLPLAAMAGILFTVAWGLIDFGEISKIVRVSREERSVLIVTLLATLSLQLEYAIYLGVLLSLLMYLHRTARPGIDDVKPFPGQHPPAFSSATGLADCPQMKIVRINGSLFFGAASFVASELQAIDERCPGQRHLLLVATGINFVDYEGAMLLAREAHRRRALGGALLVFHLKDRPLATLRECGAHAAVGAENFFNLGDDVVEASFAKLDRSICARCTVRVFAPCQRLPPPQPPGPPPGPP